MSLQKRRYDLKTNRDSNLSLNLFEFDVFRCDQTFTECAYNSTQLTLPSLRLPPDQLIQQLITKNRSNIIHFHFS